ncbi:MULTISPECIES: 4a-hydroxytetrahydrobiopterin dehydratase [Hahella]|uniref:Putative pterin-4-alpha-carbinolamine dehydratase n=1 Tax=Hahella chejuensis (strain KCTC 2396) TaxID=349521 RepID=PHS_HAHCH|nr:MULTISPECIES: 4a-hydroxytetrahydrobiopterin dehydratase [Hahella]Q2SCE8.1 RecName: Full=Putative pterin-4-alpha-carbinolamine dehydratase; Short=PHS; AltName: Full=4-alpha-hydroxy-tetrahydropterin dehydratase; AltName: Full=Pterin carbinolamine dehydratase; Short=PCD [Hahella chejuensis KCTC 2396]ABC31676.1 Pterin-4a-carbinolamine dehydratase [Hahella chejuensis KCTC 2396]MBU6952426.1 4a-hydroxytetrahydrobiopterin dehydratase [Hahella sp. HN01]MDG9668502.1 4a-hydroxytetrahydrobiopterin dehyd
MSDTIPSCEACRPDAEKVDPAKLEKYLSQVPEWRLEERNGVQMISRDYKFKNFALALEFTNKVGAIAEEINHHPELVTEWGKVRVTWWSHTIKGLHELDFAMAKRCEAVFNA